MFLPILNLILGGVVAYFAYTAWAMPL